MVISTIVQTVAVYILPLIFAITLHEAAHAYMAHRYGDDTAKHLGRLSLNPIVHIDLIGTVIFPLVSIILSVITMNPFIFGWARPVPINFSRLHNPKRNLFWIACAGPLANLIQALIWALVFKLSLSLKSYFGQPLGLMANAGITLNIGLMLLNLMPILPLDGGRMLFSILPNKQAMKYAKIEPYGMMILILLFFTGIFTYIIFPPFAFIISTIMTLIQN